MRGPSKSGLNLFGKSIAVVYLEDGSGTGPSSGAYLAGGFATRLEEDYYDGERVIETFSMQASANGDYSSKDSLVNLVLDTGKDVVFLFDRPLFGEPVVADPVKIQGQRLPADSSYVTNVSIPFTTRVYVYDSMDKNDKVYAFSGSKELNPVAYSDGKASRKEIAGKVLADMSAPAEMAGYQAAASFLSTWKEETFPVIYYDGVERAWDQGADKAYSHQWKDAINSWMTLLKSPNPEKRACASYNIALGCFMMGQPSLALEWLDRSDKENPVSLTKDLRAKINEYLSL